MSLELQVFLLLGVLNLPLHMVGDFILQTNAQAKHKANSDIHCAAHAVSYGAVFLPPLVVLAGMPGIAAAFAIALAHYTVDRYELAKQLPGLRNDPAPPDWVQKAADMALHLNANWLIFAAAAAAIQIAV
jgi:hypothetical protein